MAVNEKKNLSRQITITTHHAIISISLLLLSPSLPSVKGQAVPPSTEPYSYAKFNSSIAIIIAILVTSFFFMGFFSIYIRRWSQSSNGSVRPTLLIRSRRATVSNGLEASVIETFPTLAYSEVKGLNIGNRALECAVCLNEFEDDEMLRLLPKCDHVFHPECIDMWLASHTTCPVCRTDLVPQPGEPVHLPDGLTQSEISEGTNTNVELVQQEFHVTIIPDKEDQVLNNSSNNLQEPKPEVINRAGSLRSNRPPRSGSVASKLFGIGRFRSHSTGHYLVQSGENVDRFTLRLPEEVRKEMIRRALLNRTGSTVGLPTEGSLRKGYRTGTGEGSSRVGSYRRLESLESVVKSDRWVFSRVPSFLSRALSVRSPKVVVGDGEASTSAAAVKGGKVSMESDETGLVAADSAKLPV